MKLSDKAREEKRLMAMNDTIIRYFGLCMTLVLRDPDVMGKDTIGFERMERIKSQLLGLYNYYVPAFYKFHPEKDYFRGKLIERANKAYPRMKEDPYPDFEAMFPYIKEIEDHAPLTIKYISKDEVKR